MNRLALIQRGARQCGVTLVELMIALVLGALVVLAATAMVVSSRATYRSQDESTRLAESARFGLELSNRMVRLAGFTVWGNDTSPPPTYVPDPAWAAAPDAYALNGPNIVGANNSKPGGGPGINGSDALTIRFFGSGLQLGAGSVDPEYGNVLDCAGQPVPQTVTTTSASGPALASAVANAARAYNVLYVDYDTDGEPSLFCQRQTYDATTGAVSATAPAPQVLIRGVESFQVLFGEYMPPPTIAPSCPTLDDAAPVSIVYHQGIGGTNTVATGIPASAIPANAACPQPSKVTTTNWGNVRSVRIAMLLRSATGARTDPDPTTTYKLFGNDANASNDTGVNFNMTSLSAAEKTRIRRVVETTVFVRNRESAWTSAQFNY